MQDRINILGTEYKIETHKISEDEKLKKNHWAGYCDEELKIIVIADMNETEYFDFDEKGQETYRKNTLRHEILHAFLNESGLSDSASIPSCGWAKNEEMVDWFAIQSPKIFLVYTELGLVETANMSITYHGDGGSISVGTISADRVQAPALVAESAMI